MRIRYSPTTVMFQIVFWSIVFMLNVGPEWSKYSSFREVLEVVGVTTLLQAMVAFVALIYLVPTFLDRGRTRQFGLLLLALLLVAAELNILMSYAYLEPAYPDTYGRYYQVIGHLTLVERLGFSSMIKYIVFSKLPLFFFPAAVLIAVNYYGKQQAASTLREQKRAAELDALKSQLNPHFIFNTLNNIYALAIKRSEQTSEAVAKLSGILDYVLYRSSGEYVPLKDEVEMMGDYIALEKLRFGDRLQVTFSNDVSETVKVAPLLFLTLIENAFKHGASQELTHASIDLALTGSRDEVEFSISNSKPSSVARTTDRKPGIGLSNLRRQLDLLYPEAHRLDIEETDQRYTARLRLQRLPA